MTTLRLPPVAVAEFLGIDRATDFWRVLAHHPRLLSSTWEHGQAIWHADA